MTTATTDKRLTGIVVPEPPEGRHKTVFGNTLECTHQWAARRTPEGRSGNVYFDSGVIYSYGRHFPMAAFHRRGKTVFVLATTRKCSKSTSAHQSDVRHAVTHETVYYVENPKAQGRSEHLANLKAIDVDVKHLLQKAASPRCRTSGRLLLEASHLIARANDYAEAVGLRQRLGPPDGQDFDAWAKAAQERADAEKVVEDRRNRKRLAEQEAERKRLREEWHVKAAAWQEGGEHPGRSHEWPALDLLRIKGNVVETTQRAVVPLKAALWVLEAIRKGHDVRRSLGGDDLNVGDYHLSSIEQDTRLVRIGCHTITFDEILRLARKHNL